MVRDIGGERARTRIEPLHRVGNANVQRLAFESRELRAQGVADQLMCEPPAALLPSRRPFHELRLLRLLERGDHRAGVETGHRFEQIELEVRADHRGSRQDLARSVVHALQTTADHRPHSRGDVDLVDVQIADASCRARRTAGPPPSGAGRVPRRKTDSRRSRRRTAGQARPEVLSGPVRRAGRRRPPLAAARDESSAPNAVRQALRAFRRPGCSLPESRSTVR